MNWCNLMQIAVKLFNMAPPDGGSRGGSAGPHDSSPARPARRELPSGGALPGAAMTDPDSPVRIAYRPPGRPLRAQDFRTPPEQIPTAVEAIVAAWNRCVPARRVRVINQPRYLDLCALLTTFTAEEICQAVEFYGGQEWQRRRGAWKTFDRWIDISNVTRWVEDLAAHRERQEAADDRRRRAADDKTAAAADDAAWHRRFDELPEADRRELLQRIIDTWPKGLTNNPRRVHNLAVSLFRRETTCDRSTDGS